MDENITESLAGFDAVWRRVTGTAAPEKAPGENGPEPAPEPAFSEERALLDFIRQESCGLLAAGRLARMFQGEGRSLLQRQAADAKRRLRRLRAEYFIRTGLMPPAPDDCPATAGKLASLRAVLLHWGALARDYGQAAESTGCDTLRQLYGAFAGEAQSRFDEARALLIDSF